MDRPSPRLCFTAPACGIRPPTAFDFYVLVDSPVAALGPVSGVGARLLPPNVYFHELVGGARAKVAVMSLKQFVKGLGPETFTSTLSARFAQPSAIVFARDENIRGRLAAGFAQAVETTLARTLPLMPAVFTARDLWRRAFTLSFAAELRPEGTARIDAIVDADLARYEAVTAAVLGEPAQGNYRRAQPATRQTLVSWGLRRAAGKTLNGLRLIKAAFTFRGGLDYAAWKIKRHAGVEVVITADDRRKPLRAGLRLFVQTWKRGGVK